MAAYSEYEYINEESINDRLKCAVCTRPFVNPVLTKCKDKKHTFCLECIEDWLKRDRSCPICREQLNNEDLTYITDGPIIDLLDELKIRCKLCQQTGLERGNFSDHINKACSRMNISCPSSDIKCPWTGSRDQLDKHLKTCIFNPLRPLITQLQEQIGRLRSENEQLKCQMIQQLENQIKPLESKFVDTICLRFLTYNINFAARRKW
jgi:hypothetical protein